MLATLLLAAQLTALPTPREEVVLSSKDMVQAPPTGRAARLLAQGGAGLAAGLVMGLLVQESGLAGVVDCPASVMPTCPDARDAGLQAGFGLGAGGAVLGVGELMDGDGSLAGASMGLGLGATTALLLMFVSPELGAAASLSLPLAGALVGYEMGLPDASDRLQIRPSFSVGNGKVNVGVTGEF